MIDHALDAFLQCRSPEIQEKAHLQVEEAQVGEHLLEVNGRELLYALQLHDHPTIDKEVYAEAFLETQTIVLE